MKNENRDLIKAWKHEVYNLLFLSAVYTRQVFPKHFHNGYVIGINTRGAHKSTYRGGTWIIPPGRITVICPGEIHTGISAGCRPWTYRAIYPSTEILKILSGIDFSGQDYPVFSSPVITDQELYDMFYMIHLGFEKKIDNVFAESLLSEFIFELVRRHSSSKIRNSSFSKKKKIKTAIEFMKDSLTETISVDELSNLLGLSKFYFIRLFKTHTGMTPHAYMNVLKIRKAKELLSGKKGIVEIANNLGFTDQAHFTRIFKQISGMTPGSYRNA